MQQKLKVNARPIANSPWRVGTELRKFFGMQNAGENLQTVDNAWTGSCKVRARVDNVDSVVLCRSKRIESGELPQQFVIASGAIGIISAKG
jgi:hypothetical protein